jgi:SAM-dependent methyltransferase
VASFVQLEKDKESRAFLERCENSTGFLPNLAAPVVNMFYSITDTNAMLGRGEMFVLSTAHIKLLLKDKVRGRLLDVGAGDGGVTERFMPMIDRNDVLATEVSEPMVRRLRGKGFKAVCSASLGRSELGLASDEYFDVISQFNVLDRADLPITMLRDMLALLRPDTGDGGGIILLTVVLPFRPHVEVGGGQSQRAPAERFNFRSDNPTSNNAAQRELISSGGYAFEEAMNQIARVAFLPLGLHVHACARVPYLCAGDFKSPYYVLQDAVFVLSTRPLSEMP